MSVSEFGRNVSSELIGIVTEKLNKTIFTVLVSSLKMRSDGVIDDCLTERGRIV